MTHSFDYPTLDARVLELISERTSGTVQDGDTITASVREAATRAALRRRAETIPRRVVQVIDGTGEQIYQVSGAESVLGEGGRWVREFSKIFKTIYPFDETADLDTREIANWDDPRAVRIIKAIPTPARFTRLDGNGGWAASAAGVLNTVITSISIRFRGDALEGGTVRTLLDTTGNDYLIEFDANDALAVTAGSTALPIVAAGVFQPYLKSGWNTLVLILDSTGDNIATFNSVRIMADTTAWTPSAPASLYLGIDATSATGFVGDLDHVRIYDDATLTNLVEGWELVGAAATVSSPARDLSEVGTGSQFLGDSAALTAEDFIYFGNFIPGAGVKVGLGYTTFDEVQGLAPAPGDAEAATTTLTADRLEPLALLTAHFAAISLIGRFGQTGNGSIGAGVVSYRDKAGVWQSIAKDYFQQWKSIEGLSAVHSKPAFLPLWSGRGGVTGPYISRLGFVEW